jgi:tubulin polyglutamylase TTLL9
LQGNEEQIGGFDLIYKEKPKGKEKTVAQRISFLGTFNDRLDNLKKLAKANAVRLNDQYDLKRQQ